MNDIKPLDYAQLLHAAKTAVAMRAIVRLLPAGGPNDKIFPATYLGGKHCFEKRRINDDSTPGATRVADCVLIDSTASQANRLEAALQTAVDAGEISFPQIKVDFTEADKTLISPVRRITSEQAPHRCYDAILRDSEFEGKAFRESEPGKAITDATMRDASALLEHCPTALLFGAWDSSGPKGGLGVKFPRALSMELVGVDAQIGQKTASRIEPLGISSKVAIMGSPLNWSIGKDGAKGAQKPSEINHGNVAPSTQEGGVTVAYAEQTAILSLAALRKIGFGDASPEKAEAARALLAALGLLAYAKATEEGWDLRSRCCLVPERKTAWEIISASGEISKFSVDSKTAVDLYNSAVTAASKAGIKWSKTGITLKPSKKLLELIVKSQAIAAKESGETDENS